VLDCDLADEADLANAPQAGRLALACREGLIEFRSIRLRALA